MHPTVFIQIFKGVVVSDEDSNKARHWPRSPTGTGDIVRVREIELCGRYFKLLKPNEKVMMQNVLVRPQAAFFQPCGSITETNAAHWQDQLSQAVLTEETSSLIVDMGKLEAIDSAGLMVLVSVVKMAHRHNKRVGVCAVPNPIRIVLELTQLDRVLEIHDTHSSFVAVAAA
jgi:anti-sigma B factor antagonist